MRSLVALSTVALIAAAPVPAPSPATTSDQARGLTGSWTCRSPRGQLSRLTFSADGDGFVGEESAGPVTAYAFARQRYAPDANGGWRVTGADGKAAAFVGTAPRWTGATWDIDGTAEPDQAQGGSLYRSATDLVRAHRRGDDEAGGLGRLVRSKIVVGEVCARGDDPAAAGLCAVPDVPADVVRANEPSIPVAAQIQGVCGAVRVLVSLDEQGSVTGTHIQSSPSALLDGSALAAARLSTYRPALHDCAPVPSSYVFAVEYDR